MTFDISDTIEAKSEQLTGDDLLANPLTIKVTKVNKGSAEYPVVIHYENDKGKPFHPCKTCRRILVNVWGKDAATYIGKSMTLYRDSKVTWAGAEVGGVRISHMSHMKAPVQMSLTQSSKSKKPFTVHPLIVKEETPPVKEEPPAQSTIDAGNAAAAGGVKVYSEWLAALDPATKATVRGLHKDWTKTAKDVDAGKTEVPI